MNDVIYLIKVTETSNEYGDSISAETSRRVACSKGSVGQKEFYQSQAVGLKPEIKVTIADYLDYEGEMLVEFEGIRYRVLRTYQSGRKLELTLTRGVIPDERS